MNYIKKVLDVLKENNIEYKQIQDEIIIEIPNEEMQEKIESALSNDPRREGGA